MINYFNFKQMDNHFLITNDFGNYSFLTNKQFYNLLKDQMDASDDDEKKTELMEKGFIGTHGQEQFLTQHANKLIDMKSYLFHAPSLLVMGIVYIVRHSLIILVQD